MTLDQTTFLEIIDECDEPARKRPQLGGDLPLASPGV